LNNNVIKFTDPRKYHEEVREQACVWLSRLDKGVAPHEMEELEHWLQEDDLHPRMMVNMAAMWDQSEILSELSEIFPLEEKDGQLRTRQQKGLKFLQAMVASLVVLVSGVLGFQKMSAWDSFDAFEETYQTAVGERRQISLPDGSSLTLNTNTKLRLSFDRQVRSVFLEHGEGFFTVAKDAKRPFRVYVGARVVEAVGTAFTVQRTAAGRELEVLVTEGKVKLLELKTQEDEANSSDRESSGVMANQEEFVDEAIPLVAGERLTIAQEVQEIERDQLLPEEMEVKLAWRVGMLVFRGDPLENVLQEVSRYTTVKLVADESIRDTPVEGLFRAGDIDGLLVAMEKNFNVNSQRIGDEEILFTAATQQE
jgi:Fe2+-dicitrate sensor, membrane component